MANERQAVKDGLKTRLENISILKHVYDYFPDSIPEFPAAVIIIDE